jgi:thiol-disulfide isomerase/thioredoxin
MTSMNFQTVCLRIFVFTIAAFVLSGCSNLGKESITDVAPTAITQQTQTVILPTISITLSPDHAYPSSITETVEAPTQVAAAYPAPIDATQPVVSSTPFSTLPQGQNNLVNPYPLQGTPPPQQIELSNPAPYPPPAEVPTIVGSTITVPSTRPTEVILVTPTPQITAVASGTSVLTPQPTIVKTELVASDPTTVDLEAGHPQLVVFFAEWCTLCKSAAPVILSLESRYNDRMNFIYLDVDDDRTIPLQKKLNYRQIARPRLYLIDGVGVVLKDWSGYVLLEELQQAIDLVVPATAVPVSP